MDRKEEIDERRGSTRAAPGDSGTIPEQKDLNPPNEGREGAQDTQPVEGEDVLHPHPDIDLIQKPFPQG